MTIPASIRPFASPVIGMPDGETRSVTRGNDNILATRFNELLVHVAGNVVGPASATDNALAVYDGTTGKLIKNSSLLVSGTTIPALTGVGTLVSGAVPASLVTAGTFGAGAYTFPSTLSVTSTLTTANIVPNANDSRTIGASGNGYYELWISHNSSRASGLNLVQTLAGQGSPRLFFNNTTDFAGAANAIYQIGSNQLGFTTGGTPGSSSGTTRWTYNATALAPAVTNAMALGGSSNVWSNVFATRMTAPLFGTTTATDVVIDRDSVTQLTIGSLTATFAGALTVTGDLTQNSTQALVAQSATTARLAVGTGSGSSTTQMDIQSAAGQFAILRWRSGSSARWQFTKDNDAESGANAGSTFRGQAFDDAGTFIDNWLTVTRASGGDVAINRPVVINESGANYDTRIEGDTLTHALLLDAGQDSLGLFTSSVPNFQTGRGIAYLANATTVPTGNPSGGGFLYAEGGALKWRGSSGSITTIAVA